MSRYEDYQKHIAEMQAAISDALEHGNAIADVAYEFLNDVDLRVHINAARKYLGLASERLDILKSDVEAHARRLRP